MPWNRRYPRRKSRYVGRSYAYLAGKNRFNIRGRPPWYGTTSFSRGLVPKFGSFKLRAVLDVSSGSPSTTSFTYGYRLTQPDAVDGGSTACTDWVSVSNLYDEFRVSGIKLKFIPKRPNDPVSTTSYEPGYIFMDTDSTGLNPTVAQCVGYDNLKVVNLYRPFKVYYKVPKLINTSGTTVAYPGWMDTAAPTATGSVYFKAENLTASIDYGQMIVTYYIKTHNRK